MFEEFRTLLPRRIAPVAMAAIPAMTSITSMRLYPLIFAMLSAIAFLRGFLIGAMSLDIYFHFLQFEGR